MLATACFTCSTVRCSSTSRQMTRSYALAGFIDGSATSPIGDAIAHLRRRQLPAALGEVDAVDLDAELPQQVHQRAGAAAEVEHVRRLEHVLDQRRVLRLDLPARLEVVVVVARRAIRPVSSSRIVVLPDSTGFCSRTRCFELGDVHCLDSAACVSVVTLEKAARGIEHGVEVDDLDAVFAADDDLLGRQPRRRQSLPLHVVARAQLRAGWSRCRSG